MEGKLLTTVFDEDKNDNQIITYFRYDRKDSSCSICRDVIKYKMTPRTCLLYLAIHFPGKEFSRNQVTRLNIIFNLLLRKANFYEFNDGKAIIGYENWVGTLGPCDCSKNDIGKHIYFSQNLKILNLDVNDCTSRDEVHVISLLEDDTKYQCFLDFWTAIVDYQSLKNIFRNIFPDEIIDLIINMYLNDAMKTI